MPNDQSLIAVATLWIFFTLLSPSQGEVNHTHPRLHTDFPLVLLDANAVLVPR